MTDQENASSGKGTTGDPDQANLTGNPKKKPQPDAEVKPDPTPDDPATGPGTTSDPNQSNRT